MNKYELRDTLKRWVLDMIQEEDKAKDKDTMRKIGNVLEYNCKWLEVITFSQLQEIVLRYSYFTCGDYTLSDLRSEISTILRYGE